MIRDGKLSGFIQLFRPKNALMSILGVLVGWINVSKSISPDLILACSVPPLILMAGNAINDYFDAPIDAINKPNRPIPSGKISGREAFSSYVLLSLIGIIASIPLGIIELLIALFFAISWYAYARWLKAMGLIGNSLVSLGVAFTLIFGSLAAGTLSSKIIAFSSIAFTSNLAREVVKTIEDIEGDAAYGLRTVAIRFGLRKSGLLAAALSVLSSFLAIIPLTLMATSWAYFVLTVLISVPLLIYSAYISFKIKNKENARKASDFLKISMFLGILGMLLDPII